MGGKTRDEEYFIRKCNWIILKKNSLNSHSVMAEWPQSTGDTFGSFVCHSEQLRIMNVK